MARRLPERFHNRWGYAFAAFCGASIISLPIVISLTLPNNSGGHSGDLNTILFFILIAPIAALSAWICWPREIHRTRRVLTGAGLTAVLLSFVLLGIVLGVTMAFSDTQFFDLPSRLASLIIVPIIFTLFGSLLTFGIPYFAGVLISQIFVSTESK